MAQYDYMAPELVLEGGVVGDGVPRLLGMRMDRKGGGGCFLSYIQELLWRQIGTGKDGAVDP